MCFLSGIGVAGVCLWHTVPGFSGGVEEVRILEMYLNLREEICMKTVTTKSLDAGTESSDESIAGSLGFVMNEADAEVVEGAAATGEEGESEDEELTEDGAGAGGENTGDDEQDQGADEDAGAEDEEEADGAESDEEDATEGEGVQDGAEEGEELPKSVPKLQKRVGKLTKKLRETEAERDAVRAEVTELSERLEKTAVTVLEPSPENPLVNLNNETEVAERVSQAKAVRRWCQANPDGGEVQGKDGSIYLTPEQVRERLVWADDVVEAAPERLSFLQEQAKVDGYTRVKYPQLFKTNSPERKMADNFIRQNPGILRLPNWRLIIGDALHGLQVRLQEEKTTKTSTTAKLVVKSKVPPVKASNTPVTTARKAGAGAATARFMASGRSSDLVGAIEAGLL